MATYDWTGTDIIPNGSGSAVRADLNDALLALFSQNSSATAPPETVAYMTWADTSTGLYKIRNAANSGWITLYQLDGEWTTIALENGTAAAPSLYFKDSGTDTGVYSPGTDQVAIATAGVQRVNFNGATEVVFNDGGADVDFRIEGDTEPNLFKIDAGTDQVQVKNLNGGPLAGTRNRIINGDMRIDQRNEGTSVANSNGYTVDRWADSKIGSGMYSAQRTATAPSGFTNSLLHTVTTAVTAASTDVYQVFQGIEGFSCADFQFGTASAQSITLSFWVRSSIAGTYGLSIKNSTLNKSYVATYQVNSANTFEYKTVTIPGDTSGTWLTDNSTGLFVVFDLGSGTSQNTTAGLWQTGDYRRTSGCVNWISTNGATFYITGVQLEAGTVATPFERRSYGQELALCQRYYISAPIGTFVFASSNQYNSAQFPAAMRAYPTMTVTANSGSISGIGSTNYGFRAVNTLGPQDGAYTASAEL